jgi:hypothetical protein
LQQITLLHVLHALKREIDDLGMRRRWGRRLSRYRCERRLLLRNEQGGNEQNRASDRYSEPRLPPSESRLPPPASRLPPIALPAARRYSASPRCV